MISARKLKNNWKLSSRGFSRKLSLKIYYQAMETQSRD